MKIRKNIKPVLIRPADVPARYGFTQRQIKRWCAEGKLRRVKPSGISGPTWLRTAFLDELIERSTIPAGRKSKTA